ncbi:MAG: phosphodiester glycosidase family protein, partial [Lachnospiraceae bacterium]|nr:phosphodiester glycosidase family protein [Lachnospiraceae bacterium]
MYLSPAEVQEIVNQNSMAPMDDDVDPSLIKIDYNAINSGGDSSSDSSSVGKKEDPIQVIDVSGRTFAATLMIIKDPSRISLETVYQNGSWPEVGKPLDKLVTDAGAVAGINGGIYNQDGTLKGGHPLGIVVSHGQIQMNNPQYPGGLYLIGFDENNILIIKSIANMSSADFKTYVETAKIRDACVFQEANDDKNNHFVQLVINGEAREMNGMGSGLNPRTAIGQRADGAVLLLVTDGRGADSHLGASASDLINIMMEYGAVNAANLDGGSSSCMYYDGKYLKTSVTFKVSHASWYLPLAFVVK